jgi:hypothetical protein
MRAEGIKVRERSAGVPKADTGGVPPPCDSLEAAARRRRFTLRRRLLFAAWCACASLPLTAQLIRFSTPQPISIGRAGMASGYSEEPVIGTNGESFLVAWADDLANVHSKTQLYRQAGKTRAIRVAADGTLLDDIALGTGMAAPVGVVWTGTEWIIATLDGFARVSAGGELIGTRTMAWSMTPAYAAWTGNALVVAGYDEQSYKPLRAVTFDAQLNVLRYELLHEHGLPLGMASNDQSAVLVYRADPFSGGIASTIRMAQFGRDGLLLRHRTTTVPGSAFGGGLAASPSGFLWLYKNPAPGALWIDNELHTAEISVPAIASAWPGSDPVAWDGSAFTAYIRTSSSSGSGPTRIVAARFSGDDGSFLPPLQTAVTWNQTTLEFAVAGANGRTLLGYIGTVTPIVPTTGLLLRAFTNPTGFASAPEAEAERGVFKQELFAAASAEDMSVVVWYERNTADSPWSIYATRIAADATVMDPTSLFLGSTTCARVPPAVATDGHDFLAAWLEADQIGIGRVRADGTSVQTHSVPNAGGCGGAFSVHPLALKSNGTDYLLVWRTNDRKLKGLRLRADGTPIHPTPIEIANLGSGEGDTMRVASNGQDYLVAWDRRATRVTNQGAVLDRNTPILLGVGTIATLWWNGRTYVAEMVHTDGHRFLRIGSDGTGGRGAGAPQPPASPFLFSGSWTMPQSVVCDVGGCTGAVVRRLPGRQHTISLIRYHDDGTNISMRPRHAPEFTFESGDETPVAAEIIDAGRLAVIYLPQILAKPYSGAHRVWIAPTPPPRARAVRH